MEEILGTLRQLSEFGALGVSVGLNLYIALLLLRGKLHTQFAKEDWEKGRDEENARREAIYKKENEFREALRSETIEDRRESDQRIEKLTLTVAEQNELVRRSLDFNERLVEEVVRKGTKTPKRSSRGRTP